MRTIDKVVITCPLRRWNELKEEKHTAVEAFYSRSLKWDTQLSTVTRNVYLGGLEETTSKCTH